MDMGALPSFYYINKDQWNKLPDNLKKIVQSVIDDQPAIIAGSSPRSRWKPMRSSRPRTSRCTASRKKIGRS